MRQPIQHDARWQRAAPGETRTPTPFSILYRLSIGGLGFRLQLGTRPVACRRHATGTTVKIKIAWIGKTKEPTVTSLSEEYLSRISRYLEVEGLAVRDERDLLARFGKDRKGGSKYHLLLLDSRGKELTSEQFAKLIGNHFDRSPLPLVFAVGGADGFSDATKSSAHGLISLGKMTLPHELARVVLLEQVYRAFTILKAHPYHSGH